MDNLKYAVGGYFKAQFKIMAVVFVILLCGFGIMGMHFSILLALGIAFLDFLPFFGTGTALIPWALYELLTGDYRRVVGLLILYAVTQIVRQLIQPKLVGDSIGLNPLLPLYFSMQATKWEDFWNDLCSAFRYDRGEPLSGRSL